MLKKNKPIRLNLVHDIWSQKHTKTKREKKIVDYDLGGLLILI